MPASAKALQTRKVEACKCKALTRAEYIVLTDFMMPQLSGIELARRIRANPATAAIPIMLMSAATPKDQDASISMIIAKPFRIEDLIEKVKRFSFE